MGLRSLIALVSLVSVAWLGGCSKDATKIQPDTRGKRGESCLARNDCDTGLACLNGVCAKNEFGLKVSVKQCTRVECEADADCCGDRATSAPAKCKGREQICSAANFPGCTQAICTSDAACMGGTCRMGACQGSGQVGAACATAADCPVVTNTCMYVGTATIGTCSQTGFQCQAGLACAALPAPTCSTRTCNCMNPDYMPTSPICTDPDCENICLLRCQDSLCLQDKSCKTDAECVQQGSKICDGGRCVQCTTDDDCDAKTNETCESGLCHKPCTQNEECGLFEECNKKTGDCKYVGCSSDRECILAASRGQQINGAGGTGNQNPAPSSNSSSDPRLYKCLVSTDGVTPSSCQIPCENDGSCGQFQVCDAGYCKFVGCDSNEECRAYLGISNQMTSDAKPYVATAKCELPPTDAAASP